MQEAKVARLTIVAVGDAKVRAEDDLTGALDALASTEEDGHRLEDEVARLAVKRTSLLLELETSKMRCLLFIPKRARIRKPWRKTTKKPWR